MNSDPTVTGRSLGGGLCLYVYKNWCNTVVVRETLCTPDTELLSVTRQLYYLPRECPHLCVMLEYIHLKANADGNPNYCKTAQSFMGTNFVMGDFNQCKLRKPLCVCNQLDTSYEMLWICKGSL